MKKKILVAYFSCSGVTKGAAEELAKAAGGDLFEITPEAPYTDEDLNWENPNSRSSVEMNNPASRPKIKGKVPNMGDYDVVFVGFPIWWYIAPTIVNTFLESYDLSEKTLIAFATSGGSGFDQSDVSLRASCSPSAKWREGKLLNNLSQRKLAEWIRELNL